MATLEFCSKHNMVAYLKKTDRNTEFHQIMDFLTRSSIYYALTVSPTVLASFVEQFWTTTKSRTINNISYIDDTVAGKPAIFDTIQLMEYEGDLNTLTFNKALFSPQWKFLFHTMNHCISSKSASWDQILTNIATADEGDASEIPSDSPPIPSPPHPSEDQPQTQSAPSPRPSPSIVVPDSEGYGGNHRGQSSNDTSLSGNEDGLTLQSVYDLCVSLCKQGRKFVKSFKGESSVHKDLTFDDLDDFLDVDDTLDYMESEDAQDKGRISSVVLEENESANEGVTRWISKLLQQTYSNKPTPDSLWDDETIAQVLIIMSQNKEKLKEKEKGVEIRNVEETERPRPTSTRSILTLRPLPKIDPKDKDKKRIKEEDESDTESEGITEAKKKLKQLANDEEVARKVQKEWEAEEEKKMLAEEEATKAALSNEYDFIQARLNADKILAEKLQEEEREMYTIEQRIKFLHDTIAAQRKFLAQQRSEAIRNKPPIRNQLRNQMMTYLKHVGGKKHSKLKTKTFEEIHVLYERLKRQDQNFVAIGSAEDERQIKEMNEESKDPKKKRLKKRVVNEEDTTKTDSDHEEENQLRTFLKIVPEEEEKIDYEVLGTRYPIINWESKFYDYGHFGRELIYYRVFRADGSSRWIKTFSEMIKLFDRMDLIEIHSLVMKRFETTPPEGIDLLLWVHVLRLEDGTEINMLAERRYPLTKNTLERMMDLRLTAVSDDDTVFDLLRFIEQHIDEFGDQDGSEKDL
ncbi:hypothetical protein Tco_1304422 [Tanacetum coccineum]